MPAELRSSRLCGLGSQGSSPEPGRFFLSFFFLWTANAKVADGPKAERAPAGALACAASWTRQSMFKVDLSVSSDEEREDVVPERKAQVEAQPADDFGRDVDYGAGADGPQAQWDGAAGQVGDETLDLEGDADQQILVVEPQAPPLRPLRLVESLGQDANKLRFMATLGDPAVAPADGRAGEIPDGSEGGYVPRPGLFDDDDGMEFADEFVGADDGGLDFDNLGVGGDADVEPIPGAGAVEEDGLDMYEEVSPLWDAADKAGFGDTDEPPRRNLGDPDPIPRAAGSGGPSVAPVSLAPPHTPSNPSRPPPPQQPAAYRGHDRSYLPPATKRRLAEREDELGWLDTGAGFCPARSFRVSWGPGGTFVIPSRGADGTTANALTICRLSVAASTDACTALLNSHSEFAAAAPAAFEAKQDGPGGASAAMQTDDENAQNSSADATQGIVLAPALELCHLYHQSARSLLAKATRAAEGKAKASADSKKDPSAGFGQVGSASAAQALEHQASVWDLVYQLWTRRGRGRHTELAALGRWLQETISAERKQAPGSGADATDNAIFDCLTAGRRDQAILVAQNDGHSRLAVLLACAGLCQRDMAEQAREWAQERGSVPAPGGMSSVIRLLTGDVTAAAARPDMSWLRALGLHLWYSDSPGGVTRRGLDRWDRTVESVVESYLMHAGWTASAGDRPVQVPREPANPPMPPYAVSPGAHRPDPRRICPRALDIRFSLLRLFYLGDQFTSVAGSPRRDEAKGFEDGPLRDTGAASLFVPQKSVRSVLDYNLSWHLLQIMRLPGLGTLRLVGERGLGIAAARSVAVSYAAQLETLGMWKWAVYVLMREKQTTDAVRDLLCRHAAEAEPATSASKTFDRGIGAGFPPLPPQRTSAAAAEWPKTKDFLVNVCGVPPEWIDLALAQRCRAVGAPAEEVKYLLRAREWDAAHQVVLRDLVAPAVVYGEPRVVCQGPDCYLAQLEAASRRETVAGWETGGAVICRYIRARGGRASGSREAALRDAKAFSDTHVRDDATPVFRLFVSEMVVTFSALPSGDESGPGGAAEVIQGGLSSALDPDFRHAYLQKAIRERIDQMQF